MFSSKAYNLSFTATNKDYPAMVERLSNQVKLEAERYFQEGNFQKAILTPVQITIPNPRRLTLRERIGNFINRNRANIRNYLNR
jgi:hypothetical protein